MSPNCYRAQYCNSCNPDTAKPAIEGIWGRSCFTSRFGARHRRRGVVGWQAMARGVGWRSATTTRLRQVGTRNRVYESTVMMSPQSNLEPAQPLPSDCSAAIAASGLPPVPRLLDRVRERVRDLHYSIRTEEAHVHWVRALVRLGIGPAAHAADDMRHFGDLPAWRPYHLQLLRQEPRTICQVPQGPDRPCAVVVTTLQRGCR